VVVSTCDSIQATTLPLPVASRSVQQADGMGSRTMDLVAKALISLMARGALFLKETPWSFKTH
jgi:hypothetical protein